MAEQMLQNLLRRRLAEGTPTEAIRAELAGMGLDDDQIRALANGVSLADAPPSIVERIHNWMPVVSLVVGGGILGVVAMVVERPVLAVSCSTVGVMLCGVALVILYIAALDGGHVRYVGLFGRVRIDIWGAVIADPRRYAGVLGMLVAGILLLVAGFLIDPQAIKKLRNQALRNQVQSRATQTLAARADLASRW